MYVLHEKRRDIRQTREQTAFHLGWLDIYIYIYTRHTFSKLRATIRFISQHQHFHY
jgi:hypothetical protein